MSRSVSCPAGRQLAGDAHPRPARGLKQAKASRKRLLGCVDAAIGHANDHVCLFLEEPSRIMSSACGLTFMEEERALFTGDNVFAPL